MVPASVTSKSLSGVLPEGIKVSPECSTGKIVSVLQLGFSEQRELGPWVSPQDEF